MLAAKAVPVARCPRIFLAQNLHSDKKADILSVKKEVALRTSNKTFSE